MSTDYPVPKPFHVRVTRLHATGGHTTRDVDIRERETWKRLVRGAKETLEQGGEHHMRPLYMDDAPATSAPAPLKLRVEELEAGIEEVRSALYSYYHMGDGADAGDDGTFRYAGECLGILEALLAKKPGTKKAGE